ncbi:recombinase family protein [Methanosalsum natronophilum]|uniref:recombinase family protein n=1 Tax=Methanosalsum natronophilum TaxID=768733 RepID=UPI0021699CC6|nr:recombinase family protein [Methanosalsum natronophilum]MCS3924097.1 DNA invertase Pin-like site-specific DNA recombinase [Methanosalsum natronophilum]
MKAGLYIRTSTVGQKNSISDQKEQLNKYCFDKGIEVVKEFVDYGVSGKDSERLGYKALIEAAQEKEFNLVLVTKIDRFGRSIVDCLVSIEKLQDLGIEFIAINQPIDTSNSMGKLMLQIMAAFAEFEREIIQERMVAGRKRAEASGVICHRPKKEIPKRKIEQYLDKGLSANAIAKILNVSPNLIVNRLNQFGYIFKNGSWIKEKQN